MELYDLYVIYRGGQTIFHKRFGTIEIDQDLITAFLTAIENFGKELLAGDEHLRVIEKGRSKVLRRMTVTFSSSSILLNKGGYPIV